LRRVTLRENSALDAGGALAVQAGTTRVKGSTINENVAGRGGAVAVEPGARLVAVNATFAGNRSYAGGGAISAGGRVGLNAVTVARNFADLDADGTGAGGGLATEIGGGYVVENSLIAQNRLGTGVRSDCSGGFDSDGDNLLRARDPAGCTGFDFAGDFFTARPGIGFLRKNGGPTQTIALKRRSPALDEAGPQSSPRRDQRDVKRGRLPDIGAYERVVADRRGA
jgi:predicted outer membrane repeat protein